MGDRKGANEIHNIIYAFLAKDVTSPFDLALDMVYTRMAQRGLVDVVEEKKLKIFTVQDFSLPGNTATLAQDCAEAARQLLTQSENGKGELWKMLLAQITRGINNRTEQSDRSAGSDF